MEGDDKNVFKLLKREGRKDKALCVQVLQYFGRLCTDENFKKSKKVDDNNEEEDSDRGSDGEDVLSEEEKYVILKIIHPPFTFIFIFLDLAFL